MFFCPESPAFLNSKHGLAGRDLVIGALTRLRGLGSNVEAEYEAMTAQGATEPAPIILPLSEIMRPQIRKAIFCSLGLAFFQQVRYLIKT